MATGFGASPTTSARAHLEVLLEVLPQSEIEKLAHHLRLLAIEAKARSAGDPTDARPYWNTFMNGITSPIAPLSGSTDPPLGLILEERDNLGRVLVAVRPFAVGEVLFSEQPMFLIPAARASKSGTLGPIMTELTKRHPGQSINLDLDVICTFFASKSSEELTILSCLESHCDADGYMAGGLADEAASLAVSIGLLPDIGRLQELAWFLRIVSVNAHTIPKIQGIALFFWLSMFSHSCSPNATYSNQQLICDEGSGVLATPRSLRHIDQGEVIAMSYLDFQMLIASTSVRQELLRVQKSFVCACTRCCSADDVRAMPCPNCRGDFCVLQVPSGMWLCRACNSSCAGEVLPLDKEEKLLKFLLEFEPPDEQTVHSLLAVINEDVGVGGQARHFLWAWMMRSLLRCLIRDLPHDEKSLKQPALKAMVVLWRLLGWVHDHAPFCLHLLAMECGVQVVRALSFAGREEEAAQLALEFELALAASVGFEDADVKFLSDLTALYSQRRCSTKLIDACIFFVECTTCGKALFAPRSAACIRISEANVLEAKSQGKYEAIWCRRCGLMPYCSEVCQVEGAAIHSRHCINAEGDVSSQ